MFLPKKAEICPQTRSVIGNSKWNQPTNVRGVIMYLPKKAEICPSLSGRIQNMEDGVYGHPVVVLFTMLHEDTVDACVLPVSCSQFFSSKRTLC